VSNDEPTQHWPPLPLLTEFLLALANWIVRPLRVLWRRSWFYRQLLQGRMPDRILFYPYDALPRRLEDADALLRGRFRFGSDSIDIYEGSIFDKRAPSRAWDQSLHEFAWLPPLATAGGEPARKLATNLVTQWIRRYTRYSEPSWLPEIIARRLVNLFAHGRFLLANSEMLWRSRLFVSLRDQSRHLARTVDAATDGLPRFEAAAALTLSGACLDDSVKRLDAGLARLETQIARQILPDGGHVSRSPESLLHAYRHIVMVTDSLRAINHPVPQSLISAHDRMAPMIRFFRHGDGALALFNGGRECDSRSIAGLLARDDVRGQPFVYAPHSAYQRLVAGRSLVIFDVGTVPKGAFSRDAHAASLAFEFSAATQRIVVNCGAAVAGMPKWDDALRATAAHSTVIVADTSMAAILPHGMARDLLGPRLMDGPTSVETARQETKGGWSVAARHDGYVPTFGIEHKRTLTLAPAGNMLIGNDVLTPKATPTTRAGTPFAVRFHLHPDIRCSISQRGDVILKLPNGEGWRFACEFGQPAVEESVYFGGDAVRRCEQIVLTGAIKDEPLSLDWALEEFGNG
jgi:uncharacterized heparinase superfamily protein